MIMDECVHVHIHVWGTCGGQRTRANQEHPQAYLMIFKKVTYDHRSMNHTSTCIVKTLLKMSHLFI